MKLNRAILNVVILSWGYAVVSSVQSWFYVVHYDNKWDIEKDRIIFDMAFVICSLIAPSYVTLSGTRVTIFTSYICHVFYLSSFLWPQANLTYAASAVLGLGEALVVVIQGQCLTENNSPCTIYRRASIFWLCYQIFLLGRDLIGHFLPSEVYDRENLTIFPLNVKVCVFIIIVSIIIGLALQEPSREYFSGGLECIPNGKVSESQESPEGLFYAVWKPLKDLFELVISTKMLHLSLILTYAGLMKNLRCFQYGDDEFNEMTHFYVRIGEIFGALFSLLCFCKKKGDSTMIDMMGFVMLFSSFSFISCVGLQNKDNSWESVEGLSGKLYYYRSMTMIERFSFGFGDACLNTQIYSLLGALYPKKSASVFALAGLYYWVGYSCIYHYILGWQLHSQLTFFFVTGTLAFICTVRVEIHYVNRTSDPEAKKESLRSKIGEILKRATDILPKIKIMFVALFNNMKKREEVLRENRVSVDVPEVKILSEK